MSKELLPDVLKGDKRVTSLAELIEKSRQEIQELLPFLFIYDLSTLSDSELEDLAWQFDVSKTAWELAQNRSQKEELVKNAVILKMKLGTPWAIKKVLKILKLGGTVKEWFEYGGTPYKFKIEIASTNRQITPKLRDKLKKLIEEYKNERSWLEEIALSYLAKGFAYWAAGSLGEQTAYTEFQKEFTQVALGTTYWSSGCMGEQTAVGRFEQ